MEERKKKVKKSGRRNEKVKERKKERGEAMVSKGDRKTKEKLDGKRKEQGRMVKVQVKERNERSMNITHHSERVNERLFIFYFIIIFC